jgi:flavin-dependent dehydrogenase
MSSGNRITVVGGGLAGLALGISLRREGVPVSVIEGRSYPRHTVCGEFICGGGIEVLHELNLYEELLAAGAAEARSLILFSVHGQRLAFTLPVPALIASRYLLDNLLARKFETSGGDLQVNNRFKGRFDAIGMVRAAGRRRANLDGAKTWFGVKAHFCGVELEADLEMHLVPGGYVGLCRQGNGQVNACGLFQAASRTTRSQRRNVYEWLSGQKGSPLRDRMSRATMVAGSSCTVAGLDLAPNGGDTRECRIGDALTMIPPLTGNGMSIALESARLAIRPLLTYSRGRLDWWAAQSIIARACDDAFRTRLRWARALHAAVFAPCQKQLMSLAMRWPAVALMMYSRTR